MVENIRKPVSSALKNFTSIVMIIALFVIIWLGFKLVTNPLAFEYKNVKYPENLKICPGESFTYEVDVVVNKSPVTIVKSDVLFSEDAKKPENFFYEEFSKREIFPWDAKVHGVIHRVNTVTLPVKNQYGMNVSSGKFRYIANLNSEGVKETASLSVPFEVPESCFTK